MTTPDFSDLDLNICRGRIVLSLVALLSVYVDPTTGGAFYLDAHTLTVLGVYLVYALGTYVAFSGGIASSRLPTIFAVLDVAFAGAVALVTEGPTSPAYVFFAFAIIAVGCRSGYRATLAVTLSSVVAYMLIVLFSDRGLSSLYMMRPAYLAITGYLIGFFGQQRANFESRVRELETAAERHTIARSFHDGYVQALAGILMRLESHRDILTHDQVRDALADLTDLQNAVAREYDEVRAYIRSLAKSEVGIVRAGSPPGINTEFHINAVFTSRGLIVEQVIQIILEGMRNTLRHGRARAASIDVRDVDDALHITIDDDGVGFQESGAPPWTIASRVAEFGGSLRLSSSVNPGAHLEIEMPRA
jgi:signal transduction histidine kinase